jgi:hypothetical protein
MSGGLPQNGVTYNLSYPITTTTRAVRKVDAQQVVSVPPNTRHLLGLGASLNASSTGSLKPTAAVIDPILGPGPAVTQVPTSVAAGGVATSASGAVLSAAGGVAFASSYFTSRLGGAIGSAVTFNPKAQAASVAGAIGGPAGFILGKFFDKNSPDSVTDKLARSSKDVFSPPIDLSQYTFNLSPHEWSLPIAPSKVDQRDFNKHIVSPGSAQDKGNSSTKSNVVGTNPNTSPKNAMRRGRIVWYATASDTKFASSSTQTTPTADARQMGFQFLWNPDSFGTAVNLNPDVTPSMQDRFVGVAGAFPGQESITLNLEINRINDFACFAHKGPKEWDPNARKDREKQWGNNFSKFYTPHKLGKAGPDIMQKQLRELYELGTLHDIEFLYQTINGPNASYMSGGWKNSLGRVTSDIGFLSATLVKIEIGPLNYLGYINAISVNHIQFTTDMKPIRSQVQITANLMASVGLAEGA